MKLNKSIPLALLIAASLLAGWLERGTFLAPTAVGIVSTVFAFAAVALVFWWFRIDASERNLKPSRRLQVCMVALTIITLPYYLFKTRGGKRGAAATAGALGVFVVAMICHSVGGPVTYATKLALKSELTINDVTQLNPITVSGVIKPHYVEEIAAAVAAHPGPIAVGGGRFSMGGQTATDLALHLDMREFDQVLHFSPEKKEITVQSGITWRKLQSFIDPYDLSLQIMQTYSNFTVGGSLSVNVHGRYIGQGPLVLSVKSIRIVLADGSVVTASPDLNKDLFYGAIGGYGAMGVIVEATLALTDNVRVERKSVVMPLAQYKDFFFTRIKSDPNTVFHNADIYPTNFDTVRAMTFAKTDKPVTETERLIPGNKGYAKERAAFWFMSEFPGGQTLRQHALEPLLYSGDVVEWRNYEASYDVKELEPASRKDSTYVLQEYFVPVAKLEQFVPKMGEILKRHKVNTINVSIRHAKPDPGTMMAWAREEVFAYVLYYKQGTTDADRSAVRAWTRELIDAATKLGGTYYLPYQIHATPEQFGAAYPKSKDFFAFKQSVDPTNKFRNRLWDAYYKPAVATLPAPTFEVVAPLAGPVIAAGSNAKARTEATLKHFAGYQRDEAQTYLTLPEWFLVYSPDEYAQYIKTKAPSGFPYMESIGQFWQYYWDAYSATRGKYGFNWGYHLMVFVIGSSYTAENAIKGAYENTIGRISEMTRSGPMTPEDNYGAKVAQDYVDFIRVDPWYEFPFASALTSLWSDTPLVGPDMLRKWERKVILSVEYGAKAQYALLIKLASKAAYGDADTEMMAIATKVSRPAIYDNQDVRLVTRFEDGSALLTLPRYEKFRESVMRLAKQGVQFREIAGNDEILVTALAPAGWRYAGPNGKVLFEHAILTDPTKKRVAMNVPVASLSNLIQQLPNLPITIEHIYDY
jgi:FAD/FMN-containing dehydrogenase